LQRRRSSSTGRRKKGVFECEGVQRAFG